MGEWQTLLLVSIIESSPVPCNNLNNTAGSIFEGLKIQAASRLPSFRSALVKQAGVGGGPSLRGLYEYEKAKVNK